MIGNNPESVLNQNYVRRDASEVKEQTILRNGGDSRVINKVIAMRTRQYLEETNSWVFEHVGVETPNFDERVVMTYSNSRNVRNFGSFVVDVYEHVHYTLSEEDCVREIRRFINETVEELAEKVVESARDIELTIQH